MNDIEPNQKIVVAELTKDEHHILMALLSANLSHAQSLVTQLSILDLNHGFECKCGECPEVKESEIPEMKKAKEKMLKGQKKAVEVFQALIEKLK